MIFGHYLLQKKKISLIGVHLEIHYGENAPSIPIVQVVY